jgi:hypothetical protein
VPAPCLGAPTCRIFTPPASRRRVARTLAAHGGPAQAPGRRPCPVRPMTFRRPSDACWRKGPAQAPGRRPRLIQERAFRRPSASHCRTQMVADGPTSVCRRRRPTDGFDRGSVDVRRSTPRPRTTSDLGQHPTSTTTAPTSSGRPSTTAPDSRSRLQTQPMHKVQSHGNSTGPGVARQVFGVRPSLASSASGWAVLEADGRVGRRPPPRGWERRPARRWRSAPTRSLPAARHRATHPFAYPLYAVFRVPRRASGRRLCSPPCLCAPAGGWWRRPACRNCGAQNLT